MKRLSIGDRSDESDDTLRTLGEGIRRVETIRGESGDGAIEKFKAQLVEHNTRDVDCTGNRPVSLARRIRIMRIRTCYASPPPCMLEDAQGERTPEEQEGGNAHRQALTNTMLGSGRIQEVV